MTEIKVTVGSTKIVASVVQGMNGKTAYQSAVSGGYTGTEGQFNAILASIPTNASQLPFTPTGDLSSTNVQGALNELDAQLAEIEKDVDDILIFIPRGKNLFNKNNRKIGYFVNYATGAYSVNANYDASELIPVIPNTQIRANPTLVHYAFYDNNKNYISGGNVNAVLTVPATAYYFAFSFYPSNIATQQLFYGSEVPIYKPFQWQLKTDKDNLPIVFDKVFTEKSWYDKKADTFGDSLTQQFLWQPYVVSKLGLTSISNHGIGGARIADTNNDINSMCRQERINTLDTVSDVLIVMGGTNDWTQDVPLGTIDSIDVTKFYGALNVMTERLLVKFPTKRIIYIAPPFQIYPNRSGWNNTVGVLNNYSLATKDYANAMQIVAENYGIPCINLSKESGWNKLNYANYLQNQTFFLHPNDNGAKIISELVVGKLRSIEPIA